MLVIAILATCTYVLLAKIARYKSLSASSIADVYTNITRFSVVFSSSFSPLAALEDIRVARVSVAMLETEENLALIPAIVIFIPKPGASAFVSSGELVPDIVHVSETPKVFYNLSQ